jgi:hypothetical protein
MLPASAAETEGECALAVPPLIIIIVFLKRTSVLLASSFFSLSFSQGTPLHWSAWNGRLEVTRLLLQCNADIDAKDSK